MRTPFGEMVYRAEAEPRCRTVDFIFETPGGENVLATRVVPHGLGAVFAFTIHRVPGMSDVEWEGRKRRLGEELAELKKLLEG